MDLKETAPSEQQVSTVPQQWQTHSLANMVIKVNNKMHSIKVFPQTFEAMLLGPITSRAEVAFLRWSLVADGWVLADDSAMLTDWPAFAEQIMDDFGREQLAERLAPLAEILDAIDHHGGIERTEDGVRIPTTDRAWTLDDEQVRLLVAAGEL